MLEDDAPSAPIFSLRQEVGRPGDNPSNLSIRAHSGPARQFVPESGCISPPPGPVSTSIHFMSQHPSLKGKGAIQAKRSVLKRFERVDLLKKRGQFKDGQRVLGLPKTKPED